MKKIILGATVVLLSAAGGAWIAHRSMMSGMQGNMSTEGAQAVPDHRHVLVKKQDAQGKTYYTCVMHPQVHLDHPGNCPICGMQLVKKAEEPAAMPDANAAAGDRKPMYWYDPMKPDQHFEAAGKSPFMDMQLVPMYADATAAGGADIISIDPRVVQNLGIRTAPVERKPLRVELRASGSVAADEDRIRVVQTRAAGWVERLHVRATGDAVKQGQLLAEIYSPDLYAAQQEFLLSARSNDAGLTAAARQRLLLLGLSGQQVARLAKSGEAQQRVAYYAPVDGVVTELGVREGSQVNPGMSLYTLADLSKVWINAEIPESQIARVAAGATVQAILSALPGQTFNGRIEYVYPEVSMQTRTLKVRTVIDNKQQLLKPGMYADIILGQGGERDALVIPSEAVIRTGTRSTVIVAVAEGRFRPVEVSLGAQRDGQTEVLSGLEEGQRVVASGQFLIDSEANLRGAFSKLNTADPAMGDASMKEQGR